MEEVLGVEGDSHAGHRYVVVMTRAVADICSDSKCNWFSLPEGTKWKERQKCQIC